MLQMNQKIQIKEIELVEESKGHKMCHNLWEHHQLFVTDASDEKWGQTDPSHSLVS